MELDPAALNTVVVRALDEDLGRDGDLTSDAVIPETDRARASILARQTLVLAGIPVIREICRVTDDDLCLTPFRQDSERVAAGTNVARIEGRLRSILRIERTVLNFLMRMSGIATAARSAVEEVRGTSCRILDTRKTAPGLRLLDKYAVAQGGATNHRMGLFDALMIKDTHLHAGRTVGELVRRAREAGHPAEIITAEVRSIAELEQAIAAGAGRALLDNLDLDTMARAAQLARGRILLEASGGLRPGSLREVAETGVDFLSLGWLTHSAPAADLAMELENTS